MKKPAKSLLQMRQRELAWALYITEGARANLEHALVVNCVTFTSEDRIAMQASIQHLQKSCDRLRRRLGSLQ